MIKLIAFLGNPGTEYKNTRHNAGHLFFEYLYKGETMQSKFHSLYVQKDGVKAIKCLTYMNLSGTPVSEAASFFKLKPEEILVCHDDTEIALGETKLQKGGGLQGHKGLRSIKERIGSDGFWRLRIGIGRPKHGDLRLFVTSPFTEDEKIALETAFRKAEKDLKSI